MERVDFDKMFAKIISRAWSDEGFKKRLLGDPKGVAAEYGFKIPPGLDVKVVENTPDVTHVILPLRPAAAVLSDEQLEAIAGGIKQTTVILPCESGMGTYQGPEAPDGPCYCY
jgi:hypothetical protein